MWLLESASGLLTDLYELTMAQAYFTRRMTGEAWFEVTIRRLPPDWGFFVMAGLAELDDYLRRLAFSPDDLAYLASLDLFTDDFLDYLSDFRPHVRLRALREGTIFFSDEPVLEAGGPLIDVQLLEPCALNILGFSILEASLAARVTLAARGVPVIDFGFRRAQGPVAALRAARGGQIAGFAATSNVSTAQFLGLPPAGTMAHSFIEVHDSEEQAFRAFCELYREKAVLLVDTWDLEQGIRTAARVARDFCDETGVQIRGIRIDSGDLVRWSRFARRLFHKQNVGFLKIFVSSGLDEFAIDDLLAGGAEIDGFGVGTSFTTSRHAPALDIVYKIVQYQNRRLSKTSPEKLTFPGMKTLHRLHADGRCTEDRINPYRHDYPDELLQPFTSPEPMDTIQRRLKHELAQLPDPVKQIRSPAPYPVRFALPV